MNAHDILYYGNTKILEYVQDLPEEHWNSSGVCGWWSVREIMAHLASFEHMLTEVIDIVQGAEAGPYLRAFSDPVLDFNDVQVEKRKAMSATAVMAEYANSQARTMETITNVAPDLCRRPGTLPWYGEEYSLDDFIVYTFYGHKREHGAQIGVFRDSIGL